MANVLMVTSEAGPFAKSGGLGDVLEALPPALVAAGDCLSVMLPRYRCTFPYSDQRILSDMLVPLGPTQYRVSIHEVRSDRVSWLFVDCPELYARDGLYVSPDGKDYPDNPIRFGVLSRAAVEYARRTGQFDLLHAHDWQTALVPVYLDELAREDKALAGIRTVFTLHNLGYQGIFDPWVIAALGLDHTPHTPGRLEYWGRVNLMKGGIVFADAVTTVSPTYAREIQAGPEMGFGLEGVIRERGAAVRGIVDGIDYSRWSPQEDAFLPQRFSAGDLGGKHACRAQLLRELGFAEPGDTMPLVGMISRLVEQKGFDILIDALPGMRAAGFRTVIQGLGSGHILQKLEAEAAAHPEFVRLVSGVDSTVSHRLNAAADMMLIPSRYEPCGLSQLYAMRYGTIPVVRATGGLNDTVDETTGFKFAEYSAAALLDCLTRAKHVFQNEPERWRQMIQTGMQRDWSWAAPAREYSRLYRELLDGRPGRDATAS